MWNRREMLAASAGILATGRAARWTERLMNPNANVLLFQGDSITDCDRDRSNSSPNNARALGTGYPMLLTAMLREAHPDKDLQVYNRGVSGNIVSQLQSRWHDDTINLAPRYLSILIGVNDIWHNLGKVAPDVILSTYEHDYMALMDQTKKELPNTSIVVLEPFVLRTGAVNDSWFPTFDQVRAIARRVSDHAGARFVPLHEMFQKRAAANTPAYWAADGVHPTAAGHEAIAHAWVNAVKL